MKRSSSHQTIGVILIVVGICAALLLPSIASAARVFPTIVPNCDQEINTTTKTVNPSDRCDFTDFIQLFVNLFDWGLAILSILSVTFFIIGGAVLLLSGGNTDRVRTGASILKNTLYGIIVALGSWLIVNSIIGILAGSGTFENVQVFGRNWWGVPSCSETYNRDCSQYSLENGCGDISTNYISDLQRLLIDAGCAQITADGCFGPQTEGAVATFNEANDIDDGGTATRKTWDALRAGKSCATLGVPEVIAPGNGCCVDKCGASGIENTSQAGCADAFKSDALWYAGSCNNTASEKIGCCVFKDATFGCVQNTTRDWCIQRDGVPFDDKTCDDATLTCTVIDRCS